MALELTRSQSWQEVYGQLHQVTPDPMGGRGYIPIPDINVPVLLSGGLVAVDLASQDALSHWWLGARMYVQLGEPPSNIGIVSIMAINLPMNRGATLVQIPKLDALYLLRFEIPFWHTEMTLHVYEYIGPDEPQGVFYGV